MPFWPEALYELSARDRQVTWLEPVIFRGNETGDNFGSVIYTVPDGRLLLLQNAYLQVWPDVGNQVTDWKILIGAPGPSFQETYLRASQGVTFAINLVLNEYWSGSVVVPEKWSVRGIGVFSGAAVGDYVDFSMHGLLVPIGNVQRV